tara:strand:- start:1102 stop:1359 length:258 start_codon:yes stop_codon:yes gene_type:complete
MAFSTEIFGPNTGTSIADRRKVVGTEQSNAEKGRGGDSMMVRHSPFTIKLLQDIGGAGSFNPETGMLEFYNLDDAVKKAVKKFNY